MFGWLSWAIVSTSRWNRRAKVPRPAASRVQDLERDGPLHPPVPGLEDRPHAAGAEPVEHDVIAEEQLLGPPSAHGIDLEPGEQAGPHEVPGEVVRRGSAVAGLRRGAEGLFREQPAPGQVPHELVARDRLGHVSALAPRRLRRAGRPRFRPIVDGRRGRR